MRRSIRQVVYAYSSLTPLIAVIAFVAFYICCPTRAHAAPRHSDWTPAFRAQMIKACETSTASQTLALSTYRRHLWCTCVIVKAEPRISYHAAQRRRKLSDADKKALVDAAGACAEVLKNANVEDFYPENSI